MACFGYCSVVCLVVMLVALTHFYIIVETVLPFIVEGILLYACNQINFQCNSQNYADKCCIVHEPFEFLFTCTVDNIVPIGTATPCYSLYVPCLLNKIFICLVC